MQIRPQLLRQEWQHERLDYEIKKGGLIRLGEGGRLKILRDIKPDGMEWGPS